MKIVTFCPNGDGPARPGVLDGDDVSKFDEEKMYPVRMKCAMVFQHATLFDSMTCAENVALPLEPGQVSDPVNVGEALVILTVISRQPSEKALLLRDLSVI